MEIDQIKEVKKSFEKLKEAASGEGQEIVREKIGELEREVEKLGEKLKDEVDLWERESEDAHEKRGEKIKEFRQIIEEIKN